MTMAETTGFEPVVVFNDYNGLANRRFQPLSHVSPRKIAFFILADQQTLSSRVASNIQSLTANGLTRLTDRKKIAN